MAVKKRKVTKKKKTTKRKVAKKKVTKKKKTTRRKVAKKKVTKKKKTTKRKVTKKKKVVKKKKSKRKGNAAFMKKFKASAALQAVVGASSISRPQATKKFWAYVKKYNLQDPKNRRMILIVNKKESKLKALFPSKKAISMFEVAKMMSKHLS
ncbi:MAG: SWIB/MDM2 domain-containing protein [Bdellovibrionales bacterium]